MKRLGSLLFSIALAIQLALAASQANAQACYDGFRQPRIRESRYFAVESGGYTFVCDIETGFVYHDGVKVARINEQGKLVILEGAGVVAPAVGANNVAGTPAVQAVVVGNAAGGVGGASVNVPVSNVPGGQSQPGINFNNASVLPGIAGGASASGVAGNGNSATVRSAAGSNGANQSAPAVGGQVAAAGNGSAAAAAQASNRAGSTTVAAVATSARATGTPATPVSLSKEVAAAKETPAGPFSPGAFLGSSVPQLEFLGVWRNVTKGLFGRTTTFEMDMQADGKVTITEFIQGQDPSISKRTFNIASNVLTLSDGVSQQELGRIESFSKDRLVIQQAAGTMTFERPSSGLGR